MVPATVVVFLHTLGFEQSPFSPWSGASRWDSCRHDWQAGHHQPPLCASGCPSSPPFVILPYASWDAMVTCLNLREKKVELQSFLAMTKVLQSLDSETPCLCLAETIFHPRDKSLIHSLVTGESKPDGSHLPFSLVGSHVVLRHDQNEEASACALSGRSLPLFLRLLLHSWSTRAR